jgi:hypothetical protein
MSKPFVCNNFRREIRNPNGMPDIPESGTKWHFFDAFRAFVHVCTRGLSKQTEGGLRSHFLLCTHA